MTEEMRLASDLNLTDRYLYRPNPYLVGEGDEAPVGGDLMHWSDICPVDGDRVWAGGRPVEPIGDDEPIYYGVPYTSWGDYHGGTVERSNFRVLLNDYKDHLVETRDSMGTVSLMVRGDQELPEILAEIIDGLSDYCLIDESDHSELEWELQQEDWTEWARDDFRWEITKHVHEEAPAWDEEQLTDDFLNDLMQRAYSDGVVDWEGETAVSGYFRGLDELADDIAAEIVDEWNARHNELGEAYLAAMHEPIPGQTSLEI